MIKHNILIVDDEKDIIDLLSYNLKKNDFNVISANNGKEALLKLNNSIDLIILDIMMPEMDGYETCKSIKSKTEFKNIPIFFLTAKGTSDDEFKGLKIGAEDYIKKPISIKNLILRINNLFKRLSKKSNSSFIISKNQIMIENRKIKLTKIEFELLEIFTKNLNRIFNRQEILNKVWGYDTYISDRTVDVHINNLRRKIGKKYFKISSAYGRGYFMEKVEKNL